MRPRCWVFAAVGLLMGTPAPAQTQDPNLQWTLPSAGLLNGSRAAIENGPCCEARPGAATVRNSDAAFYTRIHRLVAWWPAHRTYVVAVGLYEESVAYLVAERDGRTLVTTAPPVLSPSGRQAIALVSNLMSGVDLEVIDVGRDPPTLAKVTTMPDCTGAGPNSFLRPTPVWIDDSHVIFKGASPLPEDTPDTKQLLWIEGGKASWQC